MQDVDAAELRQGPAVPYVGIFHDLLARVCASGENSQDFIAVLAKVK